MSPPTPTTAEHPGEHITGDRATDLSTKSSQERYLVHELGISYPQAKRLIRAYELDQRDAANVARIGNDTHRSDSAFIDWLMRQAPSTRKPSVKKREWRCAS